MRQVVSDLAGDQLDLTLEAFRTLFAHRAQEALADSLTHRQLARRGPGQVGAAVGHRTTHPTAQVGGSKDRSQGTIAPEFEHELTRLRARSGDAGAQYR